MTDEPLRIMIVDDEAPARRRLRQQLEDCARVFPLMIACEAGGGREALDLLETHAVDLVLLDIHMPDMTGLEVARRLLHLPQPPAVIFVTAYEEHALNAFDVSAIDYLVKPVRVPRLLAALNRVPRRGLLSEAAALTMPKGARRHLSVSERSRVLLVPVDEVVYLKAELKYLTVRTVAREYVLEESLARLEEEFGPRFLRVHRNCLVARDFIRGFERRLNEEGEAHWHVLLRGVPETLPVSRRQQSVIREISEAPRD